jgi:Flp pilus assembly protein TadG
MPRLLDRYRRHRTQASKGQALAEFTLVVVIMLVIFATVLDLGRAFYAHITVENAARAGALQAAKTPDSFSTGVCNYISNKIGCAVQNESRGSMVTIAGNQVSATCETTGGAAVGCTPQPVSGIRSRVTVSSTFNLLTPILSVFFGGQSVGLQATVAADQEFLPTVANNTAPAATATVPPTATPSPAPTGTSTPAPTATASPAPTPSCPSGQAIAPSLVVGLAGGSETVGEARTEWQVTGFSGAFSPASGSRNKLVTAQWANAAKTTPLVQGLCYPLTQAVWIDHS